MAALPAPRPLGSPSKAAQGFPPREWGQEAERTPGSRKAACQFASRIFQLQVLRQLLSSVHGKNTGFGVGQAQLCSVPRTTASLEIRVCSYVYIHGCVYVCVRFCRCAQVA